MSVPTLLQGPVQKLAFTTHVESNAIAANEAPGRTVTVRLAASANCWYLASLAGTAATNANGTYLPAGIVEYIRVPNLTIISVVQDSSGGNLSITTMQDISTP
jgi:hypothetical protein